jgi:uncharacterized protein YbjT (DUF2867 family)
MNKNILVVGGTGHHGRPVAKQLQKEGHAVRIFSRDIKRAREKMGESFEYFQGDVRNIETLIEASKGCHGLHINLNSSTLKDLKKIEYEGTLNCISAGKTNNLERITLISGAGVKRENLWLSPIKYKWKCEEAVRNSGIPYTIFAPTYFMNGLTAYVKGDRAMIIGSQKKKIKWLSVSDYATLVARAFASQKAVNKKFLMYGPDSYTLEEALSIYCKKKCPNVTTLKTSLKTFMFMATVSLNRELKYSATMMKAISKIDNSGDMSETALILGRPSMSLEKWVESL